MIFNKSRRKVPKRNTAMLFIRQLNSARDKNDLSKQQQKQIICLFQKRQSQWGE